MAQGVDRAIAAISRRQHGHVTRGQLRELGVTEGELRYRLAVGRLTRVHYGVYALAGMTSSALGQAAAAVLACGPGAALSHGSAATLWGFRKQWDRPLEVTAAFDRQRPGIRAHRSKALTRADITRHFGIRVTSAARTLLDIAPRLSERTLARTANEALLSNHLRRRELAELLARASGHRGAKRLEPFVESTGGGPTRSQYEDAFLEFTKRFGLPRPRVNVRVAGYEVDALFAAEGVIVELDGYRYHSGRRSFERDRERDAATLARGYVTVRLTWERLIGDPEREAARLQRILVARRAAAA